MTTKQKNVKPEARQAKLFENAAASERWERKLFRAARELEWLRAQRKRLLKPAPLPVEATVDPKFNDPLPEFDSRKEKKRQRDRAYRARKKAAAAPMEIGTA